MRGVENILPTEHQFNTTLADVREPLMERLDSYVEEAGDIIHPDFEFSERYRECWKLSELMAGLLAAEHEDRVAVRGALYRGLFFGFQVVNEIKTAPINKISMDIFTGEESPSDLAESIRLQVQEYISVRPAIDVFIGMYIIETAGEYSAYEHHVETAAGLVFMLCEQEVGDAYLRASADLADPEMAMRDGRS